MYSKVNQPYVHISLPFWIPFPFVPCVCLVPQSCPTLWDPMDCSPPGSSVHGDSPGKYTAVGCHALLQGIFPTPGSNPGLLHCRWILNRLSHEGSPSFPFSSVQSLSRVRLFATPRITAFQASLSITNSRSSLRPASIESVMPSHPLSSPSPPAPNPSQHQSLSQ